MEQEMIYIGTDRLSGHPDNPRKDIGDIGELAESIKQHGVMQNLTVVPDEEDGENYVVLIGHRRLAAAKEAGLKMVPCIVVEGLSRREQIALMLEENIQRNDLTLIEQVDGFQMMLDLGETVDTIAEKTGFSKSTVYHRLNIGKLDRSVLEKKMSGTAPFQLTLTDLIQLEGIEDVRKRNEILNAARSSADIVSRVGWEVKKQARDKRAEEVIRMLEEELPGIKPIPKEASAYNMLFRLERLMTINLDRDMPQEQKEELLMLKDGEGLYFWRPTYGGEIRIEHEKPEKEDAEPTEEELERQRRRERAQEIEDIRDRISDRRDIFVKAIVHGTVTGPKKSEQEALKDEAWKIFLRESGTRGVHDSFQISDIYDFVGAEIYGLGIWDAADHEAEKIKEAAEELPIIRQMLICLASMARQHDPLQFRGTPCYNQERGQIIMQCDEILEHWGWHYEDDERGIIDGTSDLYDTEDE